MKVYCVVASRHGSTSEIGQMIANQLRSHNLDVECMAPQDVHSLEGVDAVVLGSAVYMTQWLEDARGFVATYSKQLRSLPVWAFSVGLNGIPKGEVQDPNRVGPVLLSIDPIDHHTFAGRLDTSLLGLRERSIARMGGAAEGDFRNEEEIRTWADEIAAQLKEHLG